MTSPNLSSVAAALALLEGHQEHTVTVKATQARHDFFPLLASVVADPSEMVEVERKGRVQLPRPYREWLDDLLGSKVYIPADFTADAVRSAQNLFAIPERGDRLIAATAVALGVPLMTRDGEIAACAQVERLWD